VVSLKFSVQLLAVYYVLLYVQPALRVIAWLPLDAVRTGKASTSIQLSQTHWQIRVVVFRSAARIRVSSSKARVAGVAIRVIATGLGTTATEQQPRWRSRQPG